MTDAILDLLDEGQLHVATQLDRPLVVLAAAGSGKTRAITHRVAHAVRSGRYDPHATLAVTFTTKAAGEMRSRLAGLGVAQTSARTIHSAALRQCQYFWPKVYGGEFPTVSENTFGLIARATTSILHDSQTALIRDMETEISWAKSNNVAPERYADLADRRSVSGASPAQVGAVFAAYEKHKSGMGTVDFHDILLCCAHLMDQHPDVAEEIRSTYRHFVVDEYQDVSAIQHRLIELWADGRDDVCVVGDPNQSIHAFAGADAQYLLGLAEDPRNAVVTLSTNYRSTPEICDVGSRVLGRRNALVAARPSGRAVELGHCPSETAEAQSVVEWLRGQREAGVAWSEMAVLYRINAQSAAMEAALAEQAIPYVVRGSERFYDRAEVRQAMTSLSRQAGVDPGADVTQLVDAVWQQAGWGPVAPDGAGRQRERWESLNALRDMIAREGPDTPEALVSWLTRQASMQTVPVSDAVTLSTMHAAKGLEWDAVSVMGVREGLVPFVMATSEAELAEERRLLHVAVTRARNSLHISWSGAPGGKGTPSRFLDSVIGTTPVQRTSRQRKTSSARCIVCNKPLRSPTERKLRHHVECEVAFDEALYESLRHWRKEVARAASLPAFVIFTDATLQAIAEARPSTREELLALPGIGAVKWERYGAACLAIVADHARGD